MEDALARGLPAGALEQRAAQPVEAGAGARPRARARRRRAPRSAPARAASALLKTSRIRPRGDRGGQPLGDARLAGVVGRPRRAASGRAATAPRRPRRSPTRSGRCRSRSTSSPASRRPAVSITCSGTPSIWIVSPTLSRVVPGIGVTIASSAPASALSSELLPTFGWPASTTRMPSRSSAPWRARRQHRGDLRRWPRRAAGARRPARGSRSPPRESRASPRPACAARRSCRRAAPISRENAPSSERAAERAAASVLASIRSATASACARSSLSLRKARSVNSPGRARRRRGSRGRPIGRSRRRPRGSAPAAAAARPDRRAPAARARLRRCRNAAPGKWIARPRSIGAPWRSRKGT